MHTQRLFEENPYTVEFQARVIAVESVDNKKGVVLDRTFFYPTGGGQPHDMGKLNDIAVVDVQERDDVILHIVESETLSPGDEVAGAIEWKRRFDHMQQHSGQHVLSAAFVTVADANTRGFHLGDDEVTIDLDKPDLDWPLAHKVEDWANGHVWRNQNIKTSLVPEEEVSQIPFRREPKVSGDLRVVEIEGTDWSACCGTHVAATGEIGLIKILKLESYKGGTRIHFVCGGRALKVVQNKLRYLDETARQLSSSEDETSDAVARLLEEGRQLRKSLKEREGALLAHEAKALLDSSETIKKIIVVKSVLSFGDMKALQQMARSLIAEPGRLVMLAVEGERVSVVFARSADVDIDVRPLLAETCEALNGKGGGSPSMAQGSGLPVVEIEGLLNIMAMRAVS